MAGRHVDPESLIRDRDDRRRTVLVAAVLGFLLSGVVVLTVSRAAFSASTSNSGNRVAVGTVTLDDDDGGSAMFDVTGLAPGTSLERCIEVTYSGSIADPGEIRLYSGGYVDSGTLGDELDLKVEIGTGSTTLEDCTNFTLGGTIVATAPLSTFDATHANYTNGATAWDPATTPETRTFRFTIDLPADADSSVQGDSVTSLVFTWEVQS